jgi:hypothetical protein
METLKIKEKNIRKQSKEDCISVFKQREDEAKKILKPLFIHLTFFSFLLYLSTLDFYNKLIGESVCDIIFYTLFPICLLLLFLTIKWYRGFRFQKRMQTVASITFDVIEKEIEKNY